MSDKKAAITEKLAHSRSELLDLITGFDERMWETAVYADDAAWNIADLLRHLTDAERGMTRLMEIIRDGGEGVPADFDLSRWNKRVVEKLSNQTPADLLPAMTANREKLQHFLTSVEPGDWQKKGRHGSGRILTIEQICHLIADHEASHIQDIRKAIRQ
ncbi:MAG: DinB family protein [Anaerolineae bacterium]